MIFRSSRAAYSEVSDGILPKSKLLQAFIVGLVICKNEEDPSKMNALEWSQNFSHYTSMGIFPDAQGQLIHNTPASNLGYLAPPKDNFSWVPNCSLGPPGWETKVSSKKFWFGLCEIAWFLCQPIANLRRGVCL